MSPSSLKSDISSRDYIIIIMSIPVYTISRFESTYMTMMVSPDRDLSSFDHYESLKATANLVIFMVGFIWICCFGLLAVIYPIFKVIQIIERLGSISDQSEEEDQLLDQEKRSNSKRTINVLKIFFPRSYHVLMFAALGEKLQNLIEEVSNQYAVPNFSCGLGITLLLDTENRIGRVRAIDEFSMEMINSKVSFQQWILSSVNPAANTRDRLSSRAPP
uniref:Uncharacterized protein n=1 Tax=Strigamia maritima TaxID=126957 RepID=T1IVI3_STRMM